MLSRVDDPVILAKASEMISELTEKTHNTLCELLGTPRVPQHTTKLRKIFQSAVDLHYVLGAQQASFRFDFFLMDSTFLFDSQYFDDATGEENTDLEGKPIHFMVFPVLVKCGDERGQNAR